MILKILLISWIGVRWRLGRSILTAMSLFIGVLTIVVIQAGAKSAQNAIVADAILSSGKAMTLSFQLQPGIRSLMDAERLNDNLNRSLENVNGTAVLTISVGSPFPNKNIEMNLIQGDLRAIYPFPMVEGNWLGSESDIFLSIAVNEAAGIEEKLTINTPILIDFGDEKIIGKVTGMVRDGSTHPKAYALLGISQPGIRQIASTIYPRIQVNVKESKADKENLTSLIETEYARVFNTYSRIEIQRTDMVDSFEMVLSTLSIIFTVIAGLSLLVGSMGILNIGLSTLRERSDELSLRRSFGATRLHVMAIIVLEGQIIAFGASLIAIIVGYLVFPYVSSYLAYNVEVYSQSFPVQAAILGIISCSFAAFVGSLAPAIRAGRVNIASIMRI
jgi:putative ABC transport system permease protein